MGKANSPQNQGVSYGRDPDELDQSLYRFIWRHTRRDQIFLVLLTLVTMPLVYLTLEVPKATAPESVRRQIEVN